MSKIVTFENRAAYDAATLPTDESQLSYISDENKTEVSPINITTREPVDGDLLVHDADYNLYAVKGGSAIYKNGLPSDWTPIGTLFMREGYQMRVKNITDVNLKYAAYVEYSITAIADTSIVIKLRLSSNYGSDTSISVTLEDTTLSAANAALISTAITNACSTAGATVVPYCYYDETNDKIVITSPWNDYRQYICSGTNCTIALSIWGDMPVNSNAGFRGNNLANSARVMNVAKAVAHYGSNGVTPSADVALNASTDPVTLDAFTNSEYCTLLRTTYGTYATYIETEYKIQYPQKLGVFSLPDGETLTKTYGNRTVIYNGEEVYAFPVLHNALTIGFSGVTGFEAGDWHAMGVDEGCYIMDDDVLAKVAATQTAMGFSVITNSSPRWFAQRYNVHNAWPFNGGRGNLGSTNVFTTSLAGAVSLLDIRNLG